MDKPSPASTRRSAAGSCDDASERSASISASGISSLSRLCGLCFGELHHRNEAEDPGCAWGSPPGSTCPESLPAETTFPPRLRGQTSVEGDAGRTAASADLGEDGAKQGERGEEEGKPSHN